MFSIGVDQSYLVSCRLVDDDQLILLGIFACLGGQFSIKTVIDLDKIV